MKAAETQGPGRWRWRAWLAAGLILAVGFLGGVAVTLLLIRQAVVVATLQRANDPAAVDAWVAWLESRLAARLDLTEEERLQLRPALRKAAREVKENRVRNIRTMRAIVGRAQVSIDAVVGEERAGEARRVINDYLDLIGFPESAGADGVEKTPE